MEELQSTEILEREILEDARKKAVRILKSADDTIRAKTAEWEKKAAAAIDELEKKNEGQKELTAEKIMARLPVDKLRAKVEKIESLLRSAVESWYNDLSRQRILDLLSRELSKRLAVCEEIPVSSKKNVYYSGLDRREAETVLKSVKGISVKDWLGNIAEVSSAHHYPSVTLETENVRVIASISKSVDFLLQEKREELVEALVGRAFMEN
jgi:vacuolar-type H+-ATPase subunit E/Vma4